MEQRGANEGGPEGRDSEFPGVAARPKNWLIPVVLVTIREWNSYGYELMERLAEFGFEAMNPGTLYRALRRMEKEGPKADRLAGCTPSPTPWRRTSTSGSRR